jgi:hypothetical protein
MACVANLVFMKRVCFIACFALASTASGEDSIVIGRALSDAYAAALPCAEDEICMDSLYRWVIDSAKTLAGPKVDGRIIAESYQHVGVNNRYLKSLRLFVLRPATETRDAPHAPGVKYFLVSSSPIYEDGNYCLSIDPGATGLRLKNVMVRNDGTYCFDHKLLR